MEDRIAKVLAEYGKVFEVKKITSRDEPIVEKLSFLYAGEDPSEGSHMYNVADNANDQSSCFDLGLLRYIKSSTIKEKPETLPIFRIKYVPPLRTKTHCVHHYLYNQNKKKSDNKVSPTTADESFSNTI